MYLNPALYIPTEMECNLCTHPIEQDRPTTTLLCNHIFHTECVILALHRAITIDTPITLARCRTCNEHIVPVRIVEQVNNEFTTREAGAQAIQFMWETDPKFKNAIKDLRNNERRKNNIFRIMNTAISSIKKAFNETIAPAKHVIQEAIRASKDKLYALTEYKTYQTANREYKKNTKNFSQIYGARLWEIRDALADKPDALKLLPKSFYYDYNRAKYVFRVRIV